jgi:hypothetical protein
MIDYNNLFKVGEINDLNFLLVKEYANVPCVYLLRFGSEFYIGSTTSLEARLESHKIALRNGKGVCPPDLWDMLQLCEVYILYSFKEYDQNRLLTEEQRFALLLNPTLNKMNPLRDQNPFGKRINEPLDLFQKHKDALMSEMVNKRNVTQNYPNQKSKRGKWIDNEMEQRRKQRELNKMKENWDYTDPILQKWQKSFNKVDKVKRKVFQRTKIEFIYVRDK